MVVWIHFSLTSVFFSRGMLHSNPMDYAWGANGLDAIITQVSEEVRELEKRMKSKINDGTIFALSPHLAIEPV